jgi:ferredoxin
LVIGEPFASFVSEHYPDRARKIDSNEAIDILTAEAERGHVHHAFFKEALFGRFFAICNCCKCCCGAMQFWRNGLPMLASSGYVSEVDEVACVGCGNCKEHCPFNAIKIVDQLANVDQQACMGCGVCTSFCPENALSLKRDHSRSDPLDLNQLIEESCPR